MLSVHYHSNVRMKPLCHTILIESLPKSLTFLTFLSHSYFVDVVFVIPNWFLFSYRLVFCSEKMLPKNMTSYSSTKWKLFRMGKERLSQAPFHADFNLIFDILSCIFFLSKSVDYNNGLLNYVWNGSFISFLFCRSCEYKWGLIQKMS